MTREETIGTLENAKHFTYGDEKFNDAFDSAINYLKEAMWIPVTERLPEDKQSVLISCEDLYLQRLNPCIGWRNGQYWNTFTANGWKQILYPTAWMPLPNPYEKGGVT